MPSAEMRELVGLLQEQGLTADTSQMVARELTEHDALAAHLDLELGIDREHLVNPWAAAMSSMLSFTIGALLPLAAILLPPATIRIPVTFVRRDRGPLSHRRAQRPPRPVPQGARRSRASSPAERWPWSSPT